MLNKVTLIGNLGQDPEMHYFDDGSAVANVSLATSRRWKDKQTGEQQEHTEWHRLVFHRRLAEVVAEYLSQGSKIYVEGLLKTRKWRDNGGVDHYATEIQVREMQMLGHKSNSGSGRQSRNPAAQSQQPSADYSSFDDDIPF